MPIRPAGVTNRMDATAISHQLTATVHGTRCRARATLLPSASHVTHGSAASVAKGTDSAVWAACVSRGVGRTTRSVTCGGGSSSSRNPASEPRRGWSYRSATVTCGYCRRSTATSCAAASEPPPSAKKSASGSSTEPVPSPEQVPPQPGQPTGGASQVGGLLRVGAAGRWPGQRVAVDLA